MNRIYRLVLNRARGVIQVASELGGGAGKTSGKGQPNDKKHQRNRKIALSQRVLDVRWV